MWHPTDADRLQATQECEEALDWKFTYAMVSEWLLVSDVGTLHPGMLGDMLTPKTGGSILPGLAARLSQILKLHFISTSYKSGLNF